MSRPILPTRIQDLLDFCDQHGTVWTTNVAQIGLTLPQVTAFKVIATAARSNFNAQNAARDAEKAATTKSQSTIKQLRNSAGDLLRFIKAYAVTQSDPAVVYGAANIPAPATPSPAAPPGTPTKIKAVLNADGSLTLTWKCDNPSNVGSTIYNIRRKADGEKSFAFVGAAGSRRFVDETVPAGVASVQYMIQGQRGLAVGEASNAFAVYFGVGGDGVAVQITASGETTPNTTTVKAAA